MKHFIVINPHSFITPDSMNQFKAELEVCFNAKPGDEYDVHISQYPRDAIAAINHYVCDLPADETVRVYAVGGDGILFDCLNGMVAFENVELTNVSLGNSNDFIRAFGEDAKEAFGDIKRLINAPSRPVDVINCGSNYAINDVNIGLVGQTVVYANKIFPHLPPKLLRNNAGLAFALCAIRTLFDYEVMNQKYEVYIDGKNRSGIYSNICISNAACTGGSMTPNPYANPVDGLLEVIFLDTYNTTKSLGLVGAYSRGHFEKFNRYQREICNTIEIKSNDVLRVQMDGEGFFAKEIKLEIVPGGIKFFAPEGMDFFDYSGKAYKGPKKAGGRK